MTIPTSPRNWSYDGHSFEAATVVEPTRGSKRDRLLHALRAAPLTTTEITDVAGSEGLRRLRELRQMGYVIASKRVPDSTQWIYVLLDEPGKLGNADDNPGAV